MVEWRPEGGGCGCLKRQVTIQCFVSCLLMTDRIFLPSLPVFIGSPLLLIPPSSQPVTLHLQTEEKCFIVLQPNTSCYSGPNFGTGEGRGALHSGVWPHCCSMQQECLIWGQTSRYTLTTSNNQSALLQVNTLIVFLIDWGKLISRL